MATAKKTPATKKTAPKAVKAIVAGSKTTSGHRVDYKPGARIKITLTGKNVGGKVVKSTVHRVETTATGGFIYANIGTKDLPKIRGFRPSQVKGF